ncbi:hypothetical protein BJX76DRAFT_349530 [Aspergillus varians]
MSHPHLAPVHSGERPHTVYNSPSGPMNHDHLANQMSQLHIQQDRFSPSNEARSSDFIASADIDEHAGTCYVGYTFFKAQSTEGHPQSWKKVDKTRLHLGQNALSDLVRKRAKRFSIADQYQSLTIVKRPHVDRLIEDLRQSNPQFQWSCVYVKEETRDVKTKNFRRNYETTSMDIILMGKRTNCSSSEAPTQFRDQRPVQIHHPLPENQHRPPVGSGPYTDPRDGSNYHSAPMPSQMPTMHPGHVQFHQHGLSPFHPPPQFVMGEPPHPEQGNWAQNVPRSQPPYPGTVAHSYINQPPVSDTWPSAQDRGASRVTTDSDLKGHKREVPHQSKSRDHQAKFKEKRGKSPKLRLGSEPDLVSDSTSSGEENLTPDPNEEDSEDEFSSRETKSTKTPLPWRGSLHGRHSSAQPRHGYRAHYRKQPQGFENHRYGRTQDDGIVSVIPGGGRHIARHASKSHGLSRQWAAQPRIIHPQPSADDLDVLLSPLRGQAQSDSRSRMLHDWEADLEQREQFMEYQKQILKDDIGFINRSRSSREPIPAYPRGYLPRAIHY